MINDARKTLIWSALIFFSKLSKGFSGLLVAIIIGRYFGATSSGQYFLALTIILVVSQVAQLGFQQGLLKFNPVYRSKKSLLGLKLFLKNTLVISGIVSVLVTLTLYYFSWFISLEIFNKPELAVVIRYMSSTIVGWTLFRVLVSYLQSCSDMRGIVIYENILLPVLLLLGVLLAFKLDGDIKLYALFTSIIYILVMLSTIVPVRRSLQKLDSIDEGFRVSIPELLKYSMPLMAAGLIQQLVLWSDTLMLGFYMESKDLGVYNAGMKVALSTTVLLYVSNTILVPSISKYCANCDWIALKKQYQTVVFYLIMMALPIFILVVYLGDRILTLFGNEFKEAYSVLFILMIGQFVNIATGSAGYILMMSGKEKIEAINIFVTLLLNICMNMYLIPVYGIIGAAIATSASLVIVNIMRVYQNHRIVGLPWFSKDVFWLILYSSFCFIFLELLSPTGMLEVAIVIFLSFSILLVGVFMKKVHLCTLLGK